MIMKKILDRVPHRRPNKLFVPMLFTFSNACFGLFSIICALNNNYEAAAYCILCAAVMDAFDGRIARALKVQSVIGLQLDSLCDAISFCLAPAVLLYCWTVYDFGFLGLVVLATYLCCGLYRLAKFNVTADNQKQYFLGLPTPGAAFVVTALVLYQEWLESNHVKFLFHKLWLVCLVFLIAYLMVSKIKFPAMKGKSQLCGLFGKVLLLCALLFIIGTCVFRLPIFLSFVVCYVLFGCTFSFWSCISTYYARKR